MKEINGDRKTDTDEFKECESFISGFLEESLDYEMSAAADQSDHTAEACEKGKYNVDF